MYVQVNKCDKLTALWVYHEYCSSLCWMLLNLFLFPQNYNKSRIHSFRGVRLVDITLDDDLIFQGEIARYCLSIHSFGRSLLRRSYLFLLLCGQLKITIIISVHALRTYDAISNPISKLLTHGNLKQLSLGFTLYYYWLLHFSFTVLLHCWCARVLLTSDRRGIFFSSDRLKGCWKKNAWSQVRVLPFKQKMRKTVLVDYEQSLFFLSPSNKTREANWRKKRDGSQSTVLVTWFIFRNLVGQVVSLEQMIPLVM